MLGEWFHKTILGIQDRVGDDSFLEHLTYVLDRNSTLGVVQINEADLPSGSLRRIIVSRVDDNRLIEEYRRDIYSEDPRRDWAIRHPLSLAACWQAFPADDFDNLAIVRGWLDSPRVNKRWAASVLIPAAPAIGVGISVLRPRQQGAHQDAELAPLRAMVPYIYRSAALHYRIKDLQEQNIALCDALGGHSDAVFILDRTRTVSSMNTAAAALAQQGDIVHVRRNRLALSSLRADAFLEQALTEAHGVSLHAAGDGPLRLIAGSHGGRTIIARVIPLTPSSSHAAVWPRPSTALILAFDRSNDNRLMSLLQRSGLTPRESAVALAVGGGLSPREHADACNISVETVRTQLKAAMGKLGVRRQAELARVMVRLTE